MYSLYHVTLCQGLLMGTLESGSRWDALWSPWLSFLSIVRISNPHKFWVHLIPSLSSEPTGWQHGCDSTIESFCIKRSWLSESCVKHCQYMPVLDNIKSLAIGADERNKDANMGMTSDLSGTQDVGESARHPHHHLFCEEICHTF